MTIYEIKELTAKNEPYFFSHKTLKFFGQTLKSFKVTKEPDGRYRVSAPMRDSITGKNMGTTVRYFNPLTNELERE